MKSILTFTILSAIVLCFNGCTTKYVYVGSEKSDGLDDSENSTSTAPSEPDDVDDVCKYMNDNYFKKYCYENFDRDNDGKVSAAEAELVTDINCSTVEDFSGVEYFPNLKSLTSYSVRHLDLSKNAELSYIKVGNYVPSDYYSSPESAPIETLDLSSNTNLTTIDYSAFSQCYKLRSLAIPETVTTIGTSAFFYCTRLESISWPTNLTTIKNQAFMGCTQLQSVILSEGLTTIEQYTFRDCSSLTSIVIPDSVTTIGYGAFMGCSMLRSVTLSECLTSIEKYAFRDCSRLTSVVVPDNVAILEYGAFYCCTNLKSLSLSKNLTTIGEYAFGYCTNLSSVIVKAITPPALVNLAFADINRSAILYVPSESIDAYANSDWAQYFSQILPIE